MKTLLALLMMSCPVYANDIALSCFFASTNQHMLAVGSNGTVRIQWDGGSFSYGTADYQDPYLVVAEYGNSGTFKLVYDTRTQKGVWRDTVL